MEIRIETAKKSMEEVRPALNTALDKHFGGTLKVTWNGDTLELTAMGSKGTVVLEEGALVGRAELKPPASMMRPMLEQKIKAALKDAAG